MRQLPSFYENGLQFHCTGCGDCCSNHHGYSHVYLTAQDVEAMRTKLDLTKKTFLRTYARKDHGNIVLKDVGDSCVFLDEEGLCKVYEARPLQCRTYPFWPENMNPTVWEKEIKRDCPGTKEKGRVSPKTIETYLRWDKNHRYD